VIIKFGFGEGTKERVSARTPDGQGVATNVRGQEEQDQNRAGKELQRHQYAYGKEEIDPKTQLPDMRFQRCGVEGLRFQDL